MAGKLQGADHKTEAELVSAGGSKTGLLTDDKLYVTGIGINETLDDAFATGKHLTAPQIATPSATASGYNRLYPKSGNGWYSMDSGGTETSFVTGSSTTVLTNKDIDGGTASNTSRITIPKNSLTNLNALTRKEATLVYDQTNTRLMFDTGSVLQAVGTGSGGSTQTLVTNADAAVDTSGWNLFADAAGTSPVDGTGGSPSVTITRTTTAGEVLNGTASFKLSKGATNRQGDGVSTDMTLPRGLAASPAVVKFLYQTSANFSYTNGDIRVWLFDVTNSQLIQPTPYQLDGSGQAYLQFQTPNNTCTTLRLIFHVATTNASAYDFIFDDVIVYPLDANSTSELVDANYTGGSASLSTSTYTIVKYQTLVNDSHLAYSSSTGLFSVPLSGYYNISAQCRINGTVSAGQAFEITLSTTGANQGFARSNITASGSTPAFATPSVAKMGYYLTAGQTLQVNVYTDGSSPSTNNSASLDWFSIARVPGPSNVQSDNRIVVAKYSGSVSAALTANTSPYQYNTRVVDTHSAVTTGSGWKFTAPISGYYSFMGTVLVDTGATTFSIYKNGTLDTGLGVTIANNYAPVAGLTFLNAGDFADIRFAGGLNEVAFSATTLSISRLTGSTQVLPSEKVNISYGDTTGQAIGTSLGIMKFNTKNYDTHSAYSSSTGLLTVPVQGKYRVSSTVMLSSGVTVATGSFTAMAVFKNGSQVSLQNLYGTGVAQFFSIDHSAVVSCNAGDTLALYMRCTQGSGSNAYTDPTAVYLNIEKID